MFARLFRRRAAPSKAGHLYAGIVAQARESSFYTDCGVPDSFDGRFEMVALHGFLVLHRLKAATDPAAAGLAQDLVDVLFADMDRTFREMGAADLGVGRRVQRTAEALYGRIAAYDNGLAESAPVLEDALSRNVYGTLAPAAQPAASVLARLADYVRDASRALAEISDEELVAGNVRFRPPPAARH